MRVLARLKGNDNTGIVLRNTAISVAVKGASLAVALFTTPAYMRYFSANEVLGVWFTVLSVLAWILNCDMGIGNGLRNHLVYALKDHDWKKAKSYISSAYLFLSAVGAGILAVFLIVGRFVNWNAVFNISARFIGEIEMRRMVSILLAAVILQFVLRLVSSILYALQEAFVPGLLNLATNVAMFAYVLWANGTGRNGDIGALAWFYLCAVNVPMVLATIWVFSKKMPDAAPSPACFRKDYAVMLLRVGAAFLWLQLIAMVIDNTNNYLIALFVGNEAVVEYQVYNRILFFPVTMLMLLTNSIWSTITKAKAENNWAWIRASYKRTMLIVLLMGAAEFAIIPFLQIIFDLWLGDRSIPVDYAAAAVVALSSAVTGLRTILASYSNGLCELRLQAVYMTVGAVINIPLAYAFSRISSSYLAVVAANIVSMIPFILAQTVWCQKHIYRRAEG